MPADIWPQPVLDLLAAGGERPVFEDGPDVTTAAQMSALIRRVAAGLRSAGVRPGTGVILDLPVTAAAFAATIAAFAVGARVSGWRADLSAEQIAGAAVVDAGRLASLAAYPDDGLPLVAAGRAEEPARIIWTSGSTGTPKGVVQSYAAMSAAWAPYPDRWPPAVAELATRLRRYLVFGSLASQVMLEYGIITLAAGGTLVVAHRPVFPAALVDCRATASVITVGKLYQLVRDQRSRPADLRHLRALLVSGSPLAPGRLAEALDVLGPVLFHGYGQTETSMIAMLTPAEMVTEPDTLATVGRPAVDVSVRDGEIYVRTPAQASSYWRDPTESAEVFVDGWVRTRDLGHVDADGYLRLLGRARDVIIVNAQLVYAGPVERALAADAAVAEAYVVGAPDEVTGEAVHAYVVPVHGRTPDPDVLRKLVAAQVNDHAVPRTVTVIDRVPLAPSGKPDKRQLVPPDDTRGAADTTTP
ncbi:fatty acid--CoA ligase family protein [Micromonospora sp. WMMD1120]|uniref:class I adenylate-forming enzyme family protein n=1 Tax=Micromonospora sp. WMMD1120 TaxID=3016106 RepID=UPI0024163847|nr:fatty acid--CoA ligase family protein [Micromonospora sp. WMMD1120]MDG4808050.1 fatty acid--CoA ligase family protein [Micromonospora sp. WMMD1120]